MVNISNIFTQDRTRPISQMVEKINKAINREIQRKVMTDYRLLSKDMVVITDNKKTKKRLKKDKS